MGFKQWLAAAAAAMAGVATSVGLSAVPAQAAVTTVPLPIAHYFDLLVDAAHHHLFITSGSGSSSILVTDYAGQTVAAIPNEPGASGLALSTDGSTVYAALADADAVSAISTSTLTESARYFTGFGTTYPYGTGHEPTYVAYTSGKIWFGYGAATEGGIGSIDPGTSPATISLTAAPSAFYAAPILAASPSGELVAGEPGQSPLELASYDVSSGTATVLAPDKDFYDAANLGDLQITPDGKDVVVASGVPYYHQVFRVSDLSPDGIYPTNSGPNSVSISGDGSVAGGASNEIYVFPPGGSTPLNTYSFWPNWLPDHAIALTPDGTELFAVTLAGGFGGAPTLNIVPNPEQATSTISLTGPTRVRPGQAITLSGTLNGPSPYTGGQTLSVTRTDKADPGGITLPEVTTAADGSFSITDTPPRATIGTVTYQVSYAGDFHLTASTASFSVTIGH